MTARMSFTTVPRVALSPAASQPARPRRGGARGAAPAGRRSFPIQPLVAALALGFAAPSSDALPQGAQVVHGSAQISKQGSHLQVTNTPGAVIQWQSFGIGSGQSVYFQQQSNRSTVLNRVTGGSPSEILGTLGSNGRVFLVNGAGIVFGKGAVIDTAGFTASTLNISDADWKAGKVRLQAEGVPGGIAITDVVQVHGDVYLIAPQITNAGALKVHDGQAILAAGQAVTITGRGLEGIQLEVVNSGNEVLNLGSVEAGAVGMFAGSLRHSGTVQATAVESIDGKVWLKAQDSAEVAGSVTARRGATGGEIVVTGADTRVASTAALNASGAQGGGEVYVGGGWQGKETSIANAQNTRVEQGARLKADAIEVGDGGTVVVWSDGHTASHGAISARGGALGGDGGQVETSGKTLARSGLPDVSAPKGEAGTWLLDPEQIVIRAGSGSAGFGGSVGADDPAPTEIFEDEIEFFGGDLTIQARKSIVAAGWASDSDQVLTVPAGSAFRLETTDASCPTSPCGIDLVTDGPVAIEGTPSVICLSTSVASIEISAGLTNPAVPGETFAAEVRLNEVVNNGGNVTIRAAGNITLDRIDTSASNAGLIIPTISNAGNITVVSSEGALNLGDVAANGFTVAGSAGGRGGDITLEGRQQTDGTSAVLIEESLVSAGGDGASDNNGGDGGNITITLKDAGNGTPAVLQLDNESLLVAVVPPSSSFGGLHSVGGSGGDTSTGTNGGVGGSITVQGGDADTAIRIDAISGAAIMSEGGQAGIDFSGGGGVLGTNGNAGLIQIEGRDVTLDGGTYASLTRNTAAQIQVLANASTGTLTLGNGATLVVAGYDAGGTTVSAAQCTDGSCGLTLRAGAGGIGQGGTSEAIVTPRLELQVSGGGSVALDGAHALGKVHGDVAGDLSLALTDSAGDAQDLTLGTVVTSGSTSTSLGLNVGGNLSVSADATAFVPVEIGAAVDVGQQATFTNIPAFSMASGASLAAGTAVSFVGQEAVRLSAQAHADDSDSANEQLTLNADEFARITTPVLRIDNSQNGATESVSIGDNAAGTAATLDLTGGGNIGQVAIRSGGAVSQNLTAIQAAELQLRARTIDLGNAGNQIDAVAFRAAGSGGVNGSALIASANGMTLGTVTNTVDGALAGGQATVAASASGSSFVDLDAGGGTFTLSEALIGPSVRVAGAAIENGSAQGRIEATTAGAGVVTLEAVGNIGGADSTAQAIRIQLADAATDDQILVQGGSLSPVGLHVQGDGRTAQIDFGGAPTGGALALIADGDLTVDRSVSGFDRVGLQSANGDVALTTGAVTTSGALTVNADAGAIAGSDALATAQLIGASVNLHAAHGIEATTSTQSLTVGEAVAVAGAADVSINNVGTATLALASAANADGAMQVRTAGAMNVTGTVSGQSVALAGEGVTFQSPAQASASGAMSIDAGSGSLVANTAATTLEAAQLQLEAGSGIAATFDAAQVSADNSGSSGNVVLEHTGSTQLVVNDSSNAAGAWNVTSGQAVSIGSGGSPAAIQAATIDVDAGGDITIAAGSVLSAGFIALDAGGNIAGAIRLPTPQLSASAISLEAAGDIAATMDTSLLNVESASSGGTVQLTNTGSGTLSVGSGLNLGGDFELETAGALEVRAQSSGARIEAQNVTLTAQGGITVAGASSAGPEAVRPAPAAVVPAPSGSGAIVASDTLTLNANGALTLEGDETAAHVAGEHVVINASSLSLTGGTSDDAYAAIQYGTDIVLGLPSGANLSFTTGSGTNTDAVIYTTSATPSFVDVDPTWSCTPDCSPDFAHSTAGPLGDGVSNLGLTQAPTEPDGGTPAQVDIPVIQVLVQLQRVLEGERFGKVAVEAENVCR